MPPETMKLILLFCTIILTTRHSTVAEVEAQDYEAPKDTATEEEPLLRRQVRSDNVEIEARRRSSLDKNFMRFGRADKNILRFGRSSNPQNILRFGRSGENFMRFGRNDGSFMRFGRNDEDSHMRLGRPDNNFIRFGRTLETIRKKKAKNMDWNDDKPENFIRFGRNQKTNFLRLGRSDEKNSPQPNPQNKNILRFGRSDHFIRFGRSENAATESNPESSEDVAEDMKPFLDILPSLTDSEEDLIVIPPNYLVANKLNQ